MNTAYTPYESLKLWHDKNLVTHQTNTDELHLFHEKVMQSSLEITLETMRSDYGSPPCAFSWFSMGSSGRCEQAAKSDQDHGIIFEETSPTTQVYFLELGKRLGAGLNYIGYPYCDGSVMSSNPLWCQSKQEWKEQIKKWIEEDSWESIRYLLIFFDARVVVGIQKSIQDLKEIIFQSIKEHPYLLGRLMENTMYYKKSLGIFNQFLTESYGPYAGCINLKHTAFFPYVNSIRLLAIKEKLPETSTLKRITALSQKPEYNQLLTGYQANYIKLLQFRLDNGKKMDYQDVHYLDVKKLNQQEKQEFKRILADGRKIQLFAESIVKKAVK